MSLADDADELLNILEWISDQWEEIEEVTLEDLDAIDQVFPEFRGICTNNAFKVLCLVCEHSDRKRGT